MTKYILALDIGGTNPGMAMMEVLSDTKFQIAYDTKIPNVAGALVPSINDFLAKCAEKGWITETCCISVAGPVSNNKCFHPTNAKFTIDDTEITGNTKIKQVLVLNDFAAIAYAVSSIDNPNDCLLLRQIPHRDAAGLEWSVKSDGGTRAILGPGSGTGVAYIGYGAEKPVIISSEGGHGGMPFDMAYVQLMVYLCKKLNVRTFGIEALVSGKGIRYITEFFLHNPHEFENIINANPSYLAEFKKMVEAQTHKIVTDADLKKFLLSDGKIIEHENKELKIDFARIVAMSIKSNPKSLIAMRVFMDLLGTAAQSIALNGKATGGLFLAGGILPQNIDLLYQGDFMRAFSTNWQANMTNSLLPQIPVYVILDYKISFHGCARAALVLMPKESFRQVA